jgi:hypothetical protein
MTCIPKKNSWASTEPSEVNWKLHIDCVTCDKGHMVEVEQKIMDKWIHERGIKVTPWS